MTYGYALAANISPEMALARLFTTPEVQASWFADSFLAQVSLAQIEQILQEITAILGEYQSVEASGDQYLLIFEQGTVPTRIVLNTFGQITGLLFEPPQIAALDLDSLQTEFTALPGEASLLILKDDIALANVNVDQPLAVGSTFKLLILQALQQQIDAGQHSWEEILRLQDVYRSLPSGRLQDWPTDTPLTLQSLATLMISESDNTATDHLLALVGRENVEALTQHNRPFLSTREFFILKDPQNQQLLNRYRQANERERRNLLTAMTDVPLPGVNIFNNGPLALDIEWFMSGQELCDAIATVADLPPMQVNPGLARPENWQRIAFKGGSEPGVENFTTDLTDADGHHYCIAATWNNPDGIDELKFSSLYRGALSLLSADL
ncbi:beta-lactamase [Leptolyngbya sp. Heron Island J]|uniref:serine hydrolase n=1 Tax=Leptolyngbya sp. Heron Island J TaxID=1385935 RepID=UPI0003B9B58E|nr:serine hydrolase [Leptolyngbya sp. Heron Island J]ESA35561.1 beta-lactamase [Leptolyngbya sp. Heron Island J]